MRVIAGSRRSLPLKTPAGLDVRPTTDRIKETLFNMLAPEIPGCRFLDLFSGSGGIGIEALSRGASFAAFVEKDRSALACIRSNLEFTRFTATAEVFPTDVFDALRRMQTLYSEPFSVIFMDPPYHQELEKKVLLELEDLRISDMNTLFIAEAALDTDFSWVSGTGYTVLKQKKYKTNQHIWLQRS